MDYLCGHYWTGEGEAALVLKQLVFPEGNVPVVFACMAEGRARHELIESMTEWFYREALAYCAKGERRSGALEGSLEKQLSSCLDKTESAAVFLAVGSTFFLWAKGQQKVWLLNTRFGKAHHRALFSEEVLERGEMISGQMENGVGLLLATEAFGEGISPGQLDSCLAIKELNREKRLEKRLKELGDEGKRKGNGHGAAVLVVTC